MSEDGVRSEVVRGLATRFRARDLVGAAGARCAVELARRHDGPVPSEEIDAVTERFGRWLRSACNAVRPTENEAADRTSTDTDPAVAVL